MSDGTVLVLGASAHQLEVVAEAQRRGLRVVVADNVPDNPGHRAADASHVVDTTDVDAIVAVARAEGARAIVAACTDVAVPTAASVAARLGLPAAAPEAVARRATSKAEFRRWQRAAGLPAPETHEGGPPPAAGAWLVKPDRSSGSKGITIVDARADGFDAAVARARRLDPAVVVERRVPGRQVTVAGVVRGGALAWAAVLDRQTVPAPYAATAGHRLPTTLAPAAERAVLDAVDRTVAALGLGDGPVDADLVAGDEVVVLEISPRLGGNSITRLVRLATGLDLAGVAVDAALGAPLTVPAPAAARPSAVVLLGADRDGVLAYDEGQRAALAREPWVAGLELAAPGTAVRAFVDGRAVVGRGFVVADDRASVDARADELVRRLDLRAA